MPESRPEIKTCAERRSRIRRRHPHLSGLPFAPAARAPTPFPVLGFSEPRQPVFAIRELATQWHPRAPVRESELVGIHWPLRRLGRLRRKACPNPCARRRSPAFLRVLA